MLKRDGMKTVLFAAALAASTAGIAAAGQSEILAPLDRAVNALLTAAAVPNREETRVVPIVEAGGATSGYAQIVGTHAALAATRAVVDVSRATPGAGTIELLIPVSTVKRSNGTMQREYGVAVDAIVRGGQF